MKKVISVCLLSFMLSGCVIDFGGIIDIMNSNNVSNNNHNTSISISGDSKKTGLKGTEYLEYYSAVSSTCYV